MSVFYSIFYHFDTVIVFIGGICQPSSMSSSLESSSDQMTLRGHNRFVSVVALAAFGGTVASLGSTKMGCSFDVGVVAAFLLEVFGPARAMLDVLYDWLLMMVSVYNCCCCL